MATDKASSSSSSCSYSSILRRLNIFFLLIVFCFFYFHCCSAVQFDGITGSGLSSSTTKITGFGSSSFRKSIFSLQQQKQRQQQQQQQQQDLLTKKDPLDNDNDDDDDDDDQGQENKGTLWVYYEDDNVLWFQDSGSKLLICVTVDEKSGDWMIRDFSQIGSKERQRYRRPPTLDILSSRNSSTNNNNNNNNNINKGWVPLEGIFGLYKLPSGIVFVLIPKTTIVYTAPPILSSSSSSDDKKKKKKSTNSWWQINKVNQLELVYLSRYNSNNNDASTTSTSSLTQAQIKEEIRQLRLLRKALKEQEFYYIPPTNSKTKKGTNTFIMNDMTKTIQQSMLKQQQQDDDDDDTDTNWWETSDHRFVWNQAAVNPILQKYNNNNNKSQQEQHELVGVLLRHVIPLTSAFVGIQSNLTLPLSSSSSSSSNVNSTTTTSYEQILISRRSRYRAGTRFTRRGADETGAVANFVETEQVCIALLSTTTNSSSNNNTNTNSDDEKTTRISKVASHVQTRGSIPLRWSSPADVKTYRPRVRIGTDPVAQARALQLHLQETRAKYYANNDDSSEQEEQPIIFCNLIDSKSDQGRLGRAFDAVLQAVEEVDKKSTNNNMNNNINPAKHVWFDFHAQVKNGRWDRLAILLADLEPFLESHDYFLAEPTTTTTNDDADDVDDPSTTLTTNWNIRRTQKGIIRTNCMDCLDRTNVVQSILGRKVLFQQLVPEIASAAEDNNNKQEESLWIQKARKKFQKRQQLTLPWKDGEAAHRALWADNADAISKIYAGTPALKRDFTRTGKRTKIGALDDGMNSLQRYYLNK